GPLAATGDTDRAATAGGTLRLGNGAMTGLGISAANPLLIDGVTNSINGTDAHQRQITLPELTGQISIGDIRVGDSGASLGSLAIIDQNLAGTELRIWGH